MLRFPILRGVASGWTCKYGFVGERRVCLCLSAWESTARVRFSRCSVFPSHPSSFLAFLCLWFIPPAAFVSCAIFVSNNQSVGTPDDSLSSKGFVKRVGTIRIDVSRCCSLLAIVLRP